VGQNGSDLRPCVVSILSHKINDQLVLFSSELPFRERRFDALFTARGNLRRASIWKQYFDAGITRNL
jgi:hypothetical protein